MVMCRLKSLLTVLLHTVFLLFGSKLVWNHEWFIHVYNKCKCFTLDLTALFSAHVTVSSASKCICSSELAPCGSLSLIWADKRSVWRDSNESRCFVLLLAHKHYIEPLSSSSYRFIEENYIAIIIVIELSPSPSLKREELMTIFVWILHIK